MSPSPTITDPSHSDRRRAGCRPGPDRCTLEATRLERMSAVPPHRSPVPAGLIFSITAMGILDTALITASIPDILAGLGAPASMAGFILGAGTLPGIALAPVIGLLADRYGRREVLVPCLVIFGVAGGLSSLSPSIWVFIALRFAQGVGSAGLINLAIVLIGDLWSGPERARMIGRNAGVLTASLAVLPSVGGLLTDLGGFRTPLRIYPIALVTAGVLWRRLPRGIPHVDSIRTQVAGALPDLRSGRALAIYAATIAVFALIFGLLLTILPIHLDRELGLGATARGLIMGLPAILNFSAAVNLGRTTARIGSLRLVAIGAVVLTAAATTFAVSPTLGGAVTGAMLFGLGEGMIVPTLQNLITGTGRPENRGMLVAFYVSSTRAGQTLGPLTAGQMLGSLGSAGTFAAGSVLSLAIAAAAGVVLSRRRAAVSR